MRINKYIAHAGIASRRKAEELTTKNKKNTTERLELKKYNSVLKKYTVHKEIK